MCGRFTLTDDNREHVAAMLGVPAEQLIEEDYRPRWNIAPTDSHWIVRMRHEDREVLPAKWGLVQFGSKDAKRAASQINARAETLDSRPAFRNAWRKSRRCVVPADGFYEWVGPKGARQPIWLHRPDNTLFFFAGLYESWQPSPDTWQRTFTIITTTANTLIAPIHDRMPVLIPEEDLAVFGVVVILAAVVASTFAFVNGLQATGGVVGWLALRVVPQIQDRVQEVVKDAAVGVVRVVVRPVAAWLTKPPALHALKASGLIMGAAALAGIAYVVWQSSDSHSVLLAGVALIGVGLVGHYVWFRSRLAYWTMANT